MSRIVFIAPNKQLYLQVKKIVSGLNVEQEVDIFLAGPKKALEIANTLHSENVEVIISRGGTASIIESVVNIPVVEILVTGQDLAQTFQQAKKITGLPNPKVAFVVFRNMSNDIEVLSDILGIQLQVYSVGELEEIPEIIEKIAVTNADIVVGGANTVNFAVKKGLKSLLINSGDYSIKAAFFEAQKVALGRKIEKEHAQKFKTLIDYSTEGIISVNQDKVINIFNPAAERFLNCSAQEINGKRIDIVFPFIDIDTALKDRHEVIGQIIQFSNSWFSYNIAPITVNQTVVGAIITFQDITRIQEIEAKVRRNVIGKKFFAKYQFDDIVGNSPQIIETKLIAKEIGKVDATVLILGESGTGKELFAQSIHNNSQRKSGPFVAVNCAALPPNLLESELFGYVEGAFTGATKKGKPGLFEMAHKGTILLDEISEMDKYGQTRLLRVLQEKQVMRLGDDKYIPIDVRIIAATNKNLLALVQEDNFRRDLFYRLNVLSLDIPPLRERTGDVSCLMHHFLRINNHKYQKQIEFTPESTDYLSAYMWLGNVRELMYLIERLVVIINEKMITKEILLKFWKNRESSSEHSLASNNTTYLHEVNQIYDALNQCNANIKEAAEILDMDRSTLYKKLKHYKIQVTKNY
ncbi:MAG: proprionate catabolism activator, Fis family [Firmicutes bacterium]|nr:proprionate catabolism activator, Fis family [Bacillota bacterium]